MRVAETIIGAFLLGFAMFAMSWFFAITCVVMGHGPEVCGL